MGKINLKQKSNSPLLLFSLPSPPKLPALTMMPPMSALRMVPAVDTLPQPSVMPSEPVVMVPVPPPLSTTVRTLSPAMPQLPRRRVPPSSLLVSPPWLPLSTWPELQTFMNDYHEILNILLNFD